MRKMWWTLMGLLTLAAAASDYRSFEESALRKSPVIEALKLDLQAAEVRGEIATRYDNPELELEMSRFDPDKEASDNGWRAAASQPLRVYGLGDELRSYAEVLQRTARVQTQDAKSRFLLGLRSRYLDWVRAVYVAKLASESVELAERLESIAKERFESGAGTKAKAMQARLEALRAQSKAAEARQKAQQSQGELLAFAGVADLPLPGAAFFVDANTPLPRTMKLQNAALEVLESQISLREADAKRHDHLLKTWRIGGEFEKEPDQSIARLNVGANLPLFNRNTQERELARIAAQKKALETVRLRNAQTLRLQTLAKQYENLQELVRRYDTQIDEGRNLLALFEEGYKAAQSSLLDLIAAKNALIDAKRRRLGALWLLNRTKLEIDYLTGAMK